jgi:hypothetical protein
MHAFSPVLALTALSVLLPGDALPCVPNPGDLSVDFPKPLLQQVGVPVDAVFPEVPPADPSYGPQGSEDDPLFDDAMGAATPTEDGQSATLTISNVGGHLFGPNGEIQNGGLEGSCIEVEVCWPYLYPVTVTTGVKVNLGDALIGGGTRVNVQIVVWELGQICSGTMEVCPCASEA